MKLFLYVYNFKSLKKKWDGLMAKVVNIGSELFHWLVNESKGILPRKLNLLQNCWVNMIEATLIAYKKSIKASGIYKPIKEIKCHYKTKKIKPTD